MPPPPRQKKKTGHASSQKSGKSLYQTVLLGRVDMQVWTAPKTQETTHA